MDWNLWSLPLLAAIAGAVYGWLMVGRNAVRDASIADETRRIDLESIREDVVEALKLLEIDKEKMPANEYEDERKALLARGAKALRALEEGGHAPADLEAPPEPREESRPRKAEARKAARTASAPEPGGLAPEWRGALSALAVVAVLFVLWQYATSQTVDRREGASMTGNQSLGVQKDPTQAFRESDEFKTRMADLESKLSASPNDLALLNEATELQLDAGQPGEAMKFNDRALAADAKDATARTYRAVLTAMMGMEEQAITLLDGILVDYPDDTLATIYRAMVLSHLGRGGEAVAALEAAVAKKPDDPELQRVLMGMRQAMKNPAQGGPPAAGGAGGDLLVSGTIVLDPAAAASLQGTEALFLSVSDPGRPGPPVAADKKLGNLQFPMPFELTTAHIRAMPGAGGVPDVMNLKVRFDLDGNAMTQEPNAPSAVVTGVHKGQSGIQVSVTLAGASTPAPPFTGPAPAPAGNGLVGPVTAPGGGGGGGGDLLAAGTANLDPRRAAEVTGSELVFVSVKSAEGGPPLAAVRVPARFPLQFRVTTADVIPMMAGRPMPDTFNLSIRVDKDGNATTKEGEPEIVVPGVKRGASELELTLQ